MTATCLDCDWQDTRIYSMSAAMHHADENGHEVVDE